LKQFENHYGFLRSHYYKTVCKNDITLSNYPDVTELSVFRKVIKTNSIHKIVQSITYLLTKTQY